MTEEEAKQRWCPFARVYPLDDVGTAFNRMDANMAGVSGMWPAAASCIGAACMAWRQPSEGGGWCGLVAGS